MTEPLTHYHQVYETLHCGEKTGLQGGKDKEITCLACKANFVNLKGKNMQIDEFLMHLGMFHDEFKIDISPGARADKLFDEVNEFATAMVHETKEKADDEAIDVMVCAIANVAARGIKNPLHAGFMKLQRTAEKYRLKGKP